MIIKLIYHQYCIAYRFSEKFDIRGNPDSGAFWSVCITLMSLLVIVFANCLKNYDFENKFIIISVISYFSPVVIVRLILRKMGKVPPSNFKVNFNFKYWFFKIIINIILIYFTTFHGFFIL
jgi:hypothetical protein